jgi:hypothetical protein
VAFLIALSLVAAAPGAPATMPACTADSLRVSASLQGATGSMAGGIHVWNRGEETCRLGGAPEVVLRTRRGRVLVRSRSEATVLPPRKAVDAVEPGRSVFAFVLWRNWCGRWPSSGPARYNRRLVFDMTLGSGGRLLVPVVTGRPRCDAPGATSALSVSPFTKERTRAR